MTITDFFQRPKSATHKKYEALRAFYLENKSAAEVSKLFGYSKATVYSLPRDFKRQFLSGESTAVN